MYIMPIRFSCRRIPDSVRCYNSVTKASWAYKVFLFLLKEIVDKDTDQLTELLDFVNHLEGIINTTFEGLSSEKNFHVS